MNAASSQTHRICERTPARMTKNKKDKKTTDNQEPICQNCPQCAPKKVKKFDWLDAYTVLVRLYGRVYRNGKKKDRKIGKYRKKTGLYALKKVAKVTHAKPIKRKKTPKK